MASFERNRGLSGANYDRQVERYDDSAVSKMQQRYWQAKQTFIRKLKRKEDDCIVASDSELDSKLELFKAIEETSSILLCILEGYQDRLYSLAHEENSLGRFLREAGKVDKTRAGKMMAASGKTMCYTAKQRIQLQHPLARLYQEVETFQYRATADTYQTIDKMETARTAYRAALLWMKDVSQQLDPDTYKQLEKFRKVQGHVRRTKSKFDKMKVDSLQKIDMLSASRCNMFSHSLGNYQSSWVTFWEKSSKTMNTVAETFKGYQYYEFNILKELTQTSKKLAHEQHTSSTTAGNGGDGNSLLDADQQRENELDADLKSIFGDDDDKDKLIFFEAKFKDDESGDSKSKESKIKRSTLKKTAPTKSANGNNGDLLSTSDSDGYKLLDFDLDKSMTHSTSIHHHPSNNSLAVKDLAASKAKLNDLLTSLDKEEASLFSELFDLTAPQPLPASNTTFPAAASQLPTNLMSSTTTTNSNDSFLPSKWLEKAFSQMHVNPKAEGSQQKPIAPSSSSVSKKDQQTTSNSNWLNAFAELDPLANPDAIGKSKSDADRNC